MADNDFSQLLHDKLRVIKDEASKPARMAHLRQEILEGRMTLGQLFECHELAMLADLKDVQLREIMRSDSEKQVIEADISCLKEIDGGYCGDFKHHKGPCREDGSVRCDFLFGQPESSQIPAYRCSLLKGHEGAHVSKASFSLSTIGMETPSLGGRSLGGGAYEEKYSSGTPPRCDYTQDFLPNDPRRLTTAADRLVCISAAGHIGGHEMR